MDIGSDKLRRCRPRRSLCDVDTWCTYYRRIVSSFDSAKSRGARRRKSASDARNPFQMQDRFFSAFFIPFPCSTTRALATAQVGFNSTEMLPLLSENMPKAISLEGFRGRGGWRGVQVVTSVVS